MSGEPPLAWSHFPFGALPPELVAHILHLAGPRDAWRLRRVCRAWRAAAESVDWSPFELEVRSEELAEALETLARRGKLAMRGDLHVRIAFDDALPVGSRQPAGLVSALASAHSSGRGAWLLRQVDVNVRLEGDRERERACLYRGLDAIQPQASASPLCGFAIQCAAVPGPGQLWSPGRPSTGRGKPGISDGERADVEEGPTLQQRLRAALPRLPSLRRLLLPESIRLNAEELAAVAECAGGRLRELRFGGATARDLLRFPSLERLHGWFAAVGPECVTQLIAGLPKLELLRLQLAQAPLAALRALAEALPRASALRSLDLQVRLYVPLGGYASLEAAIAAARPVLRECELSLEPAPPHAPLLQTIAACTRLERLALEFPVGELEDLEVLRGLAGLPRLPRGLRVGLRARWPCATEALGEAEGMLEPCARAGTDVHVFISQRGLPLPVFWA